MRVLVVDDNVLFAQALERLLRRHVSAVTIATSGDAALALLDDPAFDLVLCDVNLPGILGTALAAMALARRPDLAGRFVLMTGDTTPVPSPAGVCVLAKPFDVRTLLALVKEGSAAKQPAGT